MELSQTAMARALGISRERLQRQLANIGISVKPKQKVSIRDAVKAMSGGDLKAEQIRETAARADKIEVENQEKDRQLLPAHDVDAFYLRHVGQIRQQIDQLAAILMSQFDDPATAFEIIDGHVKKTLIPAIRKASEQRPSQ